jgi:ADP-ribose pyrophosphatase YjhB (NUDIX family)
MAADDMLEKVTAFITREREGGTDLLLFEHPYAGLQLPAGTVIEGEEHAKAVLREAKEETGLCDLEMRQCIGHMDTVFPDEHFVISRDTSVYARPDPVSFQWAHFLRGLPVVRHRESKGFSQVNYTEYDEIGPPSAITYAITGWVPSELLSQRQRRYFYHLRCKGHNAESWTQRTDSHLFRLFWAPLRDLPRVVPPQQTWIDFVFGDLRYQFL